MDIPLDKVKAFLAKNAPFNALPAEARDRVAAGMLIEFFPRGEVFIREGGPPPEFLYLISQGAVRIFTKKGRDETLLDLRAVGDSVGAAAMIENAPPAFNAAADADTICYLAPKEIFLKLLEDYPQFRVFSAQALKGVQPGRDRGKPGEQLLPGDAALFTLPVRDLVKRPPVAASPETSIREAARIMTEERVGSLVVVDPDNRPVGIFTDTDLRRLVAATGRSVDEPIRSIMRTDPASVHADALCFDALTAMVKGNFHHLPVLDQGKLFGVVTQHDLLLLSGGNPGSVVKDVESAPSLAQLALVQHNVDRLAEHLVRRDLGVPEIQDVITLINDRLTRRLIEIGLDEMKDEGRGDPPCPWAWVGMGSAGRKEQIMRTDHDCAIVYADPVGPGGDETGDWFRILAEKIVAGLETCGFPRCREKNMADNPRWRQPVSVWREYFNGWLRETDPGALKSAGLFFDARFIYGREDLVHEIMRLVRRELLENRPFLTGLAVSALSAKPPLGFFRGFIVEKSGEHENRLNLKKNGLLPLVDAVRLVSLERRLPLTNTLDRLKALGQSGGLDPALAAEAAEAFNYMFILRMRNYVEGLAVDRFSFDWVNPELLAGVERRALKEAFKVVARLQEAVAARFDL